MNTRPILFIMILLACLGISAVPAHAGQRLVGAGKNWEQFGTMAAGDEIVLMPGRHQPGRLADLIGSGDRPIVIRSLSPDRPAIIEAENEGIRLDGPRHVIIRDLVIEGAVINGITIAPPRSHNPDDGRWDAHVTIENVTIVRTGPTGRRHAIQMVNVAHARISECTIKGWGGAAIDVLDCEDVEIGRCRLTGMPDHGQQSGIHVRGGSTNVRISDCAMENPGLFGIFLGGAGNPSLTTNGVWQSAPDPGSSNRPEAESIQVRRCLIRGSSCPIQFRSVHGCSVRNMTLMRPREIVLAIDIDPPIERPVPSRELVFGSNLIVWEPGDLKRLVHAGPGYRGGAIAFDQNLWWSPESPEQRKALGELPGEPRMIQIMNVDPQLDESLRPTARKARLVGVWAP